MTEASGTTAIAGQRMKASTATVTWAVLVAATLLGWFFAQAGTVGAAQQAVVVIAALKIYLVMAVFMGLWRAPRAWHVAAVAWIVATCGIVFVLAAGARP